MEKRYGRDSCVSGSRQRGTFNGSIAVLLDWIDTFYIFYFIGSTPLESLSLPTHKNRHMDLSLDPSYPHAYFNDYMIFSGVALN